MATLYSSPQMRHNFFNWSPVVGHLIMCNSLSFFTVNDWGSSDNSFSVSLAIPLGQISRDEIVGPQGTS